jgi:hypothetical protein
MYVGFDQYGNTFHIKEHPRKELCEQLGTTAASKMYVDGRDGEAIHTGYVIRDHWIDVFKLTPAFN